MTRRPKASPSAWALALAVSTALTLIGLLYWLGQSGTQSTRPHGSGETPSAHLDKIVQPELEPVASERNDLVLIRVETDQGISVPEGTLSYRWVTRHGHSPRQEHHFRNGRTELQPVREADKLWVDASAPGTATTTAMFDLRVARVARIVLRRLSHLKVEVRNSSDQKAILGAAIHIAPADHDTTQGSGVMQSDVEQSTDSHGLMHADLALGDYLVHCSGEGMDAQSRSVTVRADSESHVVFIMDQWTPALRGQVTEAWSAKPIAGAAITVAGREQWPVTTDEDGRFEVSLSAHQFASSSVAFYTVEPPSSRSDLATASGEFYWHTTQLDVPMSRNGAILEILDESSRATVDCEPAMLSATDSTRTEPEWRLLPIDPRGRYTLPASVAVHRSGLIRARLPGGHVRFTNFRALEQRSTDEGMVFVWRIRRERPLSVRILDAKSHESLSGATIEILGLPSARASTVRVARADSEFDAAKANAIENNIAQLIAQSASNDRGEATLLFTRGEDLYVRASKGGYRCEAMRLGVEQEASSIELWPSGALTGSVEGLPTSWADQSVLMIHPADQGTINRGLDSARIQSDGAFRIDECTPGTYEVTVMRRGLSANGSGNSPKDTVVVGQIQIHGRDDAPVCLSFRPAPQSAVHILATDAAVGDVYHLRSKSGSVRGTALVSRNGVAQVTLPPGTYELLRERLHRFRRTLVFASRAVDVPAGQPRIAVSAEFRTNPGRLRLMSEGLPVANQCVGLPAWGLFARDNWRTDGEGWLTMSAVPGDHFVLTLTPSDRSQDEWGWQRHWVIDGPCTGQSIEATPLR